MLYKWHEKDKEAKAMFLTLLKHPDWTIKTDFDQQQVHYLARKLGYHVHTRKVEDNKTLLWIKLLDRKPGEPME